MKHTNKTITLTLCALSAFSAHGAQMQKIKAQTVNLLAQPAFLLLGGSLFCAALYFKNINKSVELFNKSQEQINDANSLHLVGENNNPCVLNTMAHVGEAHSRLAAERAQKYLWAGRILFILGTVSYYTNFNFSQKR